MKKLMISIIALLLLTLTGCSEKKESITVLTNSGYEPYEMVNTSGELIGFDIELMEAIAVEMGISIEWKDVAFDGIIASLQSGQAEIAIAGISPSEERRKMVDFSDIYYNSEAGLTNYLLFDSESKITGLDDLKGLVVSAQMGTVQAGLLESLSTEYDFTVDLRTNNTQIVEEIKSGRIDVVVVEKAIAVTILEMNPFLQELGFESSLDDESGNAIAVSIGSDYTAQINEALQILKDNGTYQELVNKWFN
jgi:polar amino acid transport system substrate-binding protein